MICTCIFQNSRGGTDAGWHHAIGCSMRPAGEWPGEQNTTQADWGNVKSPTLDDLDAIGATARLLTETPTPIRHPTSGLVNLRVAIDASNCIVLTDAHGNVVTTVTSVRRWVDNLVHMQIMQEVNAAMIEAAGGDTNVMVGREGVAL